MENNNINQEQTKPVNNQSNKKTMCFIIIGIIVVAVIAIVVVLLLNKDSGTSSKSSNSNTNTNTNTNVDTNTNTNSNVVVEDGKYVIDADYVTLEYTNRHGSSMVNGIITEKEQIKVPFVNFKTADADKVNSEIKTLYTDYESRIKASNECESKNDGSPCGDHSIGYKTYYTDKTVSIVVAMASSYTDVPIPDYLVYTFDLNTGKQLTLDDLLSIKGITKEELINKSVTAIGELSASEDYIDTGIEDEMTTIESFIKNNIGLNQTKITGESGIAYFLDESGNLEMLTTIYYNVGIGYSNVIIPIK